MKLEGAYLRNILHMICPKDKDIEIKPLKVEIPCYQRPYEWGETQITNLIQDFEKNSELKKENRSYFVGAVVLVSDPNRKNVPEVIDGQQRVTTVFLLNYIKYLLLISKIDVLLEQKKVLSIQKEMERMEQCYEWLVGAKKVKEFQELALSLETELIKWLSEQNDNIIDGCRKKYKNIVGLPIDKDLADIDLYMTGWKTARASAMKNEEFAIRYSRKSLNDKLAQALKNVAIVFSSSFTPKFETSYSGEDDIIKQYINAMNWIFSALQNTEKVQHAKEPLEKVDSYIEVIDDMLNNLEFCVIISEETDDAYTLFEVLNDRACAVSDISLIKNQYLKRYCVTTDDADEDDNIEEIDELWGSIFNDNLLDKRVGKISYFATVYLTGNQTLDNKNNPKYRSHIGKYLEQSSKYSFEQLKEDIKVYEMLREIVEYLPESKAMNNSIKYENNLQKSITYRSLLATHAFGYDGVLVAEVCLILRKYMELHPEPVDMNKYRQYLNELFGDKDHINTDFEDIHSWFFEMWKVLFLAKDSSYPRKLAQEIISKSYRESKTFPICSISSQLKAEIEKEFETWFRNWKYSDAKDKYRAKVLFLCLMHMQKEGGKLVYKATSLAFNKPNQIQLDHLDAQNPQRIFDGAYYEPEAGKVREEMVQSIGNIMILDQPSNNSKDNVPLQKALRFYNGINNHWLVTEIQELLEDESNHRKFLIGTEEILVPKEKFFVDRKNRLKAYFKAILNNTNIKNKELHI